MAQDGNSLFHLAASLGSAKCLRLLLHKWQSIYMTTDMIPVLQKENVAGVSVVHLACLRAEDQQLLALVDFCPQLKQLLQGQLLERLLRLASPTCQLYLRHLAEKQGGDHRSCIVYVESQVFDSTLQRVGELRVTRSATWKSVSNECRHLFTTYLQIIDRICYNEEECEEFTFVYFLGTDKTESYSLEIDGGQVALTLSLLGRRWTQHQSRLDLVPPANSENSDDGDDRRTTRHGQRDCRTAAVCKHDVSTSELSPWDFIRMKSATSDDSSPLTLVISLPPLEDAALSCLMPVTFINRAVQQVELCGAYQLLAPDGWWLKQISQSIVFVLSTRNPDLLKVDLKEPCWHTYCAMLIRVTCPAIVAVREDISMFHETLPNSSPGSRSLVVAACPLHADRSQADDVSVPHDALLAHERPLQSLFGRLLMRNLLVAAPETDWSSETVGLAALRWKAGVPYRLMRAVEQWDMAYGDYGCVDKFRVPSMERLATAPIEFSRQEQPMLSRWIEHLWHGDLVPAVVDFARKNLHHIDELLEGVRKALLNKCPLAGDLLPVLNVTYG